MFEIDMDEELDKFYKDKNRFKNLKRMVDFEFSQDYADLFKKNSIGTFYSRIINQFSMIFNRLGSDGGLFVVIGKKNIKNSIS